MTRHDANPGQPSRRDLVKMAALGAAALTLPACHVSGQDRPAARSTAGLRPPERPDDDAWASVRAEFLIDPGTAYLNNASLGMPPAQVVQAVADGYRAISEEPLEGKQRLQREIAEVVKPGLARLLGARVDELELTRNASEALHLQSMGLDLRAGDEVLITSQEHPAGSRPWAYRALHEGIRVTEVSVPSPLPPAAEVVSRMEAAVTPRTRAIAFCHVTRGGHRYPVADLCKLASDHGLASLVDGAQAVGQFPVDLTELGCDAYSASLHKWTLAPAGTGFLFVRAAARDRIRTAFAPDATSDAPALGPPGTMPFPVQAAIGSALRFIETLGLERIEARCRYLSDHLKARLEDLPDVRLLSGPGDQSAPGSTIFEKARVDAVAAVPTLFELARVHIDEHQRDGHDAIRVSTHVYNTRAEIDRLVDALAGIG